MKAIEFKAALARQLLPFRMPSENKTRGGKCLIFAGSKGMWGAGILAATAAARMGAGYVYLFPETRSFPATRHPDFLLIHWEKQLSRIQAQAFAIGPGCQNNAKLRARIRKLQRQKQIRVILDATALSVLDRSPKSESLPETWILTPHEGELARMLQVPAEKIRKRRFDFVQMAQKKYGCWILLKGDQTLIAGPRDQIWRIPTGNSALAKAGTGDVLTGIIAALLSQGLLPGDAACLGAYVHGWMADQWIRQGRDHLSLMASDLISMLPEALMQIRKGRRARIKALK